MFNFVLHVATLACIFGVLALSLNLQAGFGGLINFGQIALYGCGLYGAGLAHLYGLHWLYGLGLAALLSLGAALGFASIGRRLSSDYWAIATLCCAEILRIAANNQDALTGGAQGISGLPVLFGQLQSTARAAATLGLCASLLVGVFLFCRYVTRGPFGLSLKVMRENDAQARALGYDTQRLRRLLMCVSALIAALSGFVFAHYVSFVGPDQLVASETFVIWAMIIVGGFGNHLGVVLGAFLLQFLFAFIPFAKDGLHLSSEYVGALRLLLTGGGILGFLLWRPDGLVPERVGAREG